MTSGPRPRPISLIDLSGSSRHSGSLLGSLRIIIRRLHLRPEMNAVDLCLVLVHFLTLYFEEFVYDAQFSTFQIRIVKTESECACSLVDHYNTDSKQSQNNLASFLRWRARRLPPPVWPSSLILKYVVSWNVHKNYCITILEIKYSGTEENTGRGAI